MEPPLYNTAIVTFKRKLGPTWSMAHDADILYVATSPKTGREKYDGMLLAAGISKAAEMGLPALRNDVEFRDEIGGHDNGYEPPFGEGASMKIILAQGKLKKDADKNGLWIDFDVDGDTGNSLRREVVGLESRGPLTARQLKRYSFKVNGYYSRSGSLFKNIDSLSKKDNIERVEEAVGNDKASAVYSLLDEFKNYSPNTRTQSNTEKVFGLGDDKLYHGLKGLLNEDVNGKYDELNGSKIAGLSDSKWKLLKFIGSRYRKMEMGKIEEYRETQEKQIDTLRERFSEPYKFARENTALFTK